MPEPQRYLEAFSAALLVSAAVAFLLGKWPLHQPRLASVLGMIVGAAAGLLALRLRVTFPPASALDRLLLVLLPGIGLVECIACVPRLPSWVAFSGRAILVFISGRILLHGSVYLTNQAETLPPLVLLVISSLAFATVWYLLDRLQVRTPSAMYSFNVALTLLCGGMTIMLAGYLKGGSASFPLAAEIFGATLATVNRNREIDQRGLIGLAVTSLFGLLFMGRFFGRLSTVTTLVLLSVPLVAWCRELPLIRNRPRWQRHLLQLVLLIIILAIILVLAKQDFDLRMKPLL